MVDINKLKARLDAVSQKTKDREGYKKDKVELFYKPEVVGTSLFRAVEYPHSSDPETEPFLERHYHFNIPGQYAVYCPSKNDGGKCSVCDFVWENMKIFKGNKEMIDLWRSRLPQLHVIVAGKPVNEDGSDIATTARFVKFRSDSEKQSDVHEKLYKNFRLAPTWMNYDDSGYNLEMEYEKPSELQKKQFSNAKIIMKKNGVVLSREKTVGWKSKEEYLKFLATVPNIDETAPFTKKTSEDMKAVMEKWVEIAEKSAQKLGAAPSVDTKSVGMTASAEEVPETQVEPEDVPESTSSAVKDEAKTPKQVKLDKLNAKLAAMGVK